MRKNDKNVGAVHTHTHTHGILEKNINKIKGRDIYANASNFGITLIALIITTIFSYDENIKSSNSKGFLLQPI